MASADVTVRIEPDGKTSVVRSFDTDGMTYVSITDFAKAAGFGHSHSVFERRHTFTNGQGRLTFVQDNRFYTIDTAAALLPIAPVRRDSVLFLPAPYLVEAFAAKHQGTLSWNEREAIITVSAARPTAVAATPAPAPATAARPTPAPAPTPAQPLQVQPVDGAATIRTIVIDPGHGGRDPGATGPTGVREKDVVLAISLELRRLLVRAGFTVHMTRERDVFIPLTQRTNFANEKNADLFVSVHANAIEGDRRRREAVRGYKIYFLSQAKNEEDKLSAMRENAVIQFEDTVSRRNYDALQDVLISILGSEYLRESQELSIIMEQTFASSRTNIRRQQLGIGQANFWVLNGAYMPAVLVEVGFISNTAEEKLLSDRRVQNQKAAAIAEAIIKFKQQLEGH